MSIVAGIAEQTQSIRPPRQKRSRESYERVLVVARELVEENGFDGFTIQQVAARAQVSIGAIYERFQNKETLLRAVHSRLMDEMTPIAPSSPAVPSSVTASRAIAESVAAVAAVMDGNRRALRAFMHFGAVDEQIAERGSEASIALSHTFKATLAPYASEFSHPDPKVGLDIAFRMTYSTLARQVMYGPVFESDRPLGWRRLVDELAAACEAYLLLRRPA